MRGWKGWSSSPKGQEQRWSSRRVFEHSRHSMWLLSHSNSVWCLQHLSTPSTDKCKWQNDREGLHFYKTARIQKKYSNINCAEWWIPAKKVPDLIIVRYTHSLTLGLNPSFSANPPYPSLSLFSFRFHYMDFPDCLLLLLSISVFLLFSFSVFTHF